MEKYSLQGTTRGNGLTGGLPPVRLSCNGQAVACGGNGGNHQIHNSTLVVKGYIVPCVEVAGNLGELVRADGFHRRFAICLKGPACARPVPLSSIP